MYFITIEAVANISEIHFDHVKVETPIFCEKRRNNLLLTFSFVKERVKTKYSAGSLPKKVEECHEKD